MGQKNAKDISGTGTKNLSKLHGAEFCRSFEYLEIEQAKKKGMPNKGQDITPTGDPKFLSKRTDLKRLVKQPKHEIIDLRKNPTDANPKNTSISTSVTDKTDVTPTEQSTGTQSHPHSATTKERSNHTEDKLKAILVSLNNEQTKEPKPRRKRNTASFVVKDDDNDNNNIIGEINRIYSSTEESSFEVTPGRHKHGFNALDPTQHGSYVGLLTVEEEVTTVVIPRHRRKQFRRNARPLSGVSSPSLRSESSVTSAPGDFFKFRTTNSQTQSKGKLVQTSFIVNKPIQSTKTVEPCLEELPDETEHTKRVQDALQPKIIAKQSIVKSEFIQSDFNRSELLTPVLCGETYTSRKEYLNSLIQPIIIHSLPLTEIGDLLHSEKIDRVIQWTGNQFQSLKTMATCLLSTQQTDRARVDVMGMGSETTSAPNCLQVNLPCSHLHLPTNFNDSSIYYLRNTARSINSTETSSKLINSTSASIVLASNKQLNDKLKFTDEECGLNKFEGASPIIQRINFLQSEITSQEKVINRSTINATEKQQQPMSIGEVKPSKLATKTSADKMKQTYMRTRRVTILIPEMFLAELISIASQVFSNKPYKAREEPLTILRSDVLPAAMAYQSNGEQFRVTEQFCRNRSEISQTVKASTDNLHRRMSQAISAIYASSPNNGRSNEFGDAKLHFKQTAKCSLVGLQLGVTTKDDCCIVSKYQRSVKNQSIKAVVTTDLLTTESRPSIYYDKIKSEISITKTDSEAIQKPDRIIKEMPQILCGRHRTKLSESDEEETLIFNTKDRTEILKKPESSIVRAQLTNDFGFLTSERQLSLHETEEVLLTLEKPLENERVNLVWKEESGSKEEMLIFNTKDSITESLEKSESSIVSAQLTNDFGFLTRERQLSLHETEEVLLTLEKPLETERVTLVWKEESGSREATENQKIIPEETTEEAIIINLNKPRIVCESEFNFNYRMALANKKIVKRDLVISNSCLRASLHTHKNEKTIDHLSEIMKPCPNVSKLSSALEHDVMTSRQNAFSTENTSAHEIVSVQEVQEDEIVSVQEVQKDEIVSVQAIQEGENWFNQMTSANQTSEIPPRRFATCVIQQIISNPCNADSDVVEQISQRNRFFHTPIQQVTNINKGDVLNCNKSQYTTAALAVVIEKSNSDEHALYLKNDELIQHKEVNETILLQNVEEEIAEISVYQVKLSLTAMTSIFETPALRYSQLISTSNDSVDMRDSFTSKNNIGEMEMTPETCDEHNVRSDLLNRKLLLTNENDETVTKLGSKNFEVVIVENSTLNQSREIPPDMAFNDSDVIEILDEEIEERNNVDSFSMQAISDRMETKTSECLPIEDTEESIIEKSEIKNFLYSNSTKESRIKKLNVNQDPTGSSQGQERVETQLVSKTVQRLLHVSLSTAENIGLKTCQKVNPQVVVEKQCHRIASVDQVTQTSPSFMRRTELKSACPKQHANEQALPPVTSSILSTTTWQKQLDASCMQQTAIFCGENNWQISYEEGTMKSIVDEHKYVEQSKPKEITKSAENREDRHFCYRPIQSVVEIKHDTGTHKCDITQITQREKANVTFCKPQYTTGAFATMPRWRAAKTETKMRDDLTQNYTGERFFSTKRAISIVIPSTVEVDAFMADPVTVHNPFAKIQQAAVNFFGTAEFTFCAPPELDRANNIMVEQELTLKQPNAPETEDKFTTSKAHVFHQKELIQHENIGETFLLRNIREDKANTSEQEVKLLLVAEKTISQRPKISYSQLISTSIDSTDMHDGTSENNVSELQKIPETCDKHIAETDLLLTNENEETNSKLEIKDFETVTVIGTSDKENEEKNYVYSISMQMKFDKIQNVASESLSIQDADRPIIVPEQCVRSFAGKNEMKDFFSSNQNSNNLEKEPGIKKMKVGVTQVPVRQSQGQERIETHLVCKTVQRLVQLPLCTAENIRTPTCQNTNPQTIAQKQLNWIALVNQVTQTSSSYIFRTGLESTQPEQHEPELASRLLLIKELTCETIKTETIACDFTRSYSQKLILGAEKFTLNSTVEALSLVTSSISISSTTRQKQLAACCTQQAANFCEANKRTISPEKAVMNSIVDERKPVGQSKRTEITKNAEIREDYKICHRPVHWAIEIIHDVGAKECDIIQTAQPEKADETFCNKPHYTTVPTRRVAKTKVAYELIQNCAGERFLSTRRAMSIVMRSTVEVDTSLATSVTVQNPFAKIERGAVNIFETAEVNFCVSPKLDETNNIMVELQLILEQQNASKIEKTFTTSANTLVFHLKELIQHENVGETFLLRSIREEKANVSVQDVKLLLPGGKSIFQTPEISYSRLISTRIDSVDMHDGFTSESNVSELQIIPETCDKHIAETDLLLTNENEETNSKLEIKDLETETVIGTSTLDKENEEKNYVDSFSTQMMKFDKVQNVASECLSIKDANQPIIVQEQCVRSFAGKNEMEDFFSSNQNTNNLEKESGIKKLKVGLTQVPVRQSRGQERIETHLVCKTVQRLVQLPLCTAVNIRTPTCQNTNSQTIAQKQLNWIALVNQVTQTSASYIFRTGLESTQPEQHEPELASRLLLIKEPTCETIKTETIACDFTRSYSQKLILGAEKFTLNSTVEALSLVTSSISISSTIRQKQLAACCTQQAANFCEANKRTISPERAAKNSRPIVDERKPVEQSKRREITSNAEIREDYTICHRPVYWTKEIIHDAGAQECDIIQTAQPGKADETFCNEPQYTTVPTRRVAKTGVTHDLIQNCAGERFLSTRRAMSIAMQSTVEVDTSLATSVTVQNPFAKIHHAAVNIFETAEVNLCASPKLDETNNVMVEQQLILEQQNAPKIEEKFTTSANTHVFHLKELIQHENVGETFLLQSIREEKANVSVQDVKLLLPAEKSIFQTPKISYSRLISTSIDSVDMHDGFTSESDISELQIIPETCDKHIAESDLLNRILSLTDENEKTNSRLEVKDFETVAVENSVFNQLREVSAQMVYRSDVKGTLDKENEETNYDDLFSTRTTLDTMKHVASEYLSIKEAKETIIVPESCVKSSAKKSEIDNFFSSSENTDTLGIASGIKKFNVNQDPATGQERVETQLICKTVQRLVQVSLSTAHKRSQKMCQKTFPLTTVEKQGNWIESVNQVTPTSFSPMFRTRLESAKPKQSEPELATRLSAKELTYQTADTKTITHDFIKSYSQKLIFSAEKFTLNSTVEALPVVISSISISSTIPQKQFAPCRIRRTTIRENCQFYHRPVQWAVEIERGVETHEYNILQTIQQEKADVTFCNKPQCIAGALATVTRRHVTSAEIRYELAPNCIREMFFITKRIVSAITPARIEINTFLDDSAIIPNEFATIRHTTVNFFETAEINNYVSPTLDTTNAIMVQKKLIPKQLKKTKVVGNSKYEQTQNNTGEIFLNLNKFVSAVIPSNVKVNTFLVAGSAILPNAFAKIEQAEAHFSTTSELQNCASPKLEKANFIKDEQQLLPTQVIATKVIETSNTSNVHLIHLSELRQHENVGVTSLLRSIRRDKANVSAQKVRVLRVAEMRISKTPEISHSQLISTSNNSVDMRGGLICEGNISELEIMPERYDIFTNENEETNDIVERKYFEAEAIENSMLNQFREVPAQMVFNDSDVRGTFDKEIEERNYRPIDSFSMRTKLDRMETAASERAEAQLVCKAVQQLVHVSLSTAKSTRKSQKPCQKMLTSATEEKQCNWIAAVDQVTQTTELSMFKCPNSLLLVSKPTHENDSVEAIERTTCSRVITSCSKMSRFKARKFTKIPAVDIESPNEVTGTELHVNVTDSADMHVAEKTNVCTLYPEKDPEKDSDSKDSLVSRDTAKPISASPTLTFSAEIRHRKPHQNKIGYFHGHPEPAIQHPNKGSVTPIKTRRNDDHVCAEMQPTGKIEGRINPTETICLSNPPATELNSFSETLTLKDSPDVKVVAERGEVVVRAKREAAYLFVEEQMTNVATKDRHCSERGETTMTLPTKEQLRLYSFGSTESSFCTSPTSYSSDTTKLEICDTSHRRQLMRETRRKIRSPSGNQKNSNQIEHRLKTLISAGPIDLLRKQEKLQRKTNESFVERGEEQILKRSNDQAIDRYTAYHRPQKHS